MCAIFVGKIVLVGIVEASRVGGWCIMMKAVLPGAWILLLLIQWIHAAMDVSYFPHVDRVWR